MSEEMAAEFDTVAAWTAEVARGLGPAYHMPAGCRGSGSPAMMRWFLDRLDLFPGARFLDCGAGVGGPAAFAAEEANLLPVLTDPESGACEAARALFGFPVVQAGSELPFRTDVFEAAWSLGVVCTTHDQPLLVAELHRVLAPEGRLGLLVFVAQTGQLSESPSGNSFPTDERLSELLAGAGLRVTDSATVPEFAAGPSLWQERVDAVEAELERRHAGDPAWQTANRQAAIIGRLLSAGELLATMIMTRPDPP
jgi:SAM-dependent methyltransferase